MFGLPVGATVNGHLRPPAAGGSGQRMRAREVAIPVCR
jgi:hypothetical protein